MSNKKEKLRAEQKQNRHSVRLSLALDALAALAGDALDDNCNNPEKKNEIYI